MKTENLENRAALPPQQRILLAAHDLFYRDGIRATGIDRVIAEAGVAKLTFYRHYPSKNHLVLAFLDHRHRLWIDWFGDALQRHGGAAAGLPALVPALAEWFNADAFRGCAFINTVVELGGAMPEAVEVSRRHKQDMATLIEGLLPPSRQRRQDAQVAALAVDGAILRAQYGEAAVALKTLQRLLGTLQLA